MRLTRLGATILEGHDIADLPLVSENAEILDNALLDLENAMGDISADDITLPNGKTVSESINDIAIDLGDKTNLVAAINELKDGVVTQVERNKWDQVEVKADKSYVDDKVKTDVPINAKFTDTIATKESIGLGDVDNIKQATKEEFNTHKSTSVHQDKVHGLGTNANNELIYFNGTDWVDSNWKKIDDPTGSPGNGNLIAGNMDAGYFGAVSTSELFSGTEIASACGITQGTAQFSNVGWLKFAIDGKIIFKPQKTYRHSISWDHINSKGCVDGTKTVSKNGHTYKVRLMKSALTDPSKCSDSDKGAKGSEWNRLMLPIHANAKNQNWAYPVNVESNIPYWGVDFTDADLHTHHSHGSGSYHWCQEVSGENASNRIGRGYAGVSNSIRIASSSTNSTNGWSPVLEFIS